MAGQCLLSLKRKNKTIPPFDSCCKSAGLFLSIRAFYAGKTFDSRGERANLFGAQPGTKRSEVAGSRLFRLGHVSRVPAVKRQTGINSALIRHKVKNNCKI